MLGVVFCSGLSEAAETASGSAVVNAVETIRLSLPKNHSVVMKNIASVFTRQVSKRCRAKVIMQGNAPLTVALSVESGMGTEGFIITDGKAGTIRIIGNDERGVLYGIGKFLRTSSYGKNGFTAGAWRGESVPAKLVRGIYFATHFHNFYHDAPVEEIARYVEEIALWGCNNLTVWYDMHHFNGFKDPEAVEFRKRLVGILQAARDLGIGISFGGLGNEGYANSPRDIRSKGGKRGGYYDCQICPSKPGGLDYRLRIHSEIMDWMCPFKPEFFWIWPFDQGGCDCAQCRPWATRGFLKCAKPVAGAAREALPGVKIVLSNWYYRGNETRELGKILSADKPWVDYVMGPVPGTTIPAVNFPEISMLGVQPWGGFGAIPVPHELQRKYAKMANLQGGWPYSEGLSEDMNKIMMLQLYWNPGQSVFETLKEYAAFEFSPGAAEDVVAMVKTLEKNFRGRKNIGADASQAYELAQKVDAQLSPDTRKSWRWRILYLRALIDKEMRLTKGALKGKVLKDAFDELTRIYHAENALEGWLKPPQVTSDSITSGKLRCQPQADLVATARGLVGRLFPKRVDTFVFESIPTDDGSDVFEVESRDGRIVVRGNSGVSMAAGLNWYLSQPCRCNMSLYGENLNLPDTRCPR